MIKECHIKCLERQCIFKSLRGFSFSFSNRETDSSNERK